jgi:hypothetical protein
MENDNVIALQSVSKTSAGLPASVGAACGPDGTRVLLSKRSPAEQVRVEHESPKAVQAVFDEVSETGPSDLPSNTNPSVLALEIAKGMHAGARAVIQACVLLNKGSVLYDGDLQRREQFRNALVGERVIARKSARLGGVEKSMLSMLGEIGKHADLLLDERIFKFLEPGRSVLHYVTRLYKVVPGDHDDRVARLVEIFEPEGSLSRDFLVAEVKKEQQKLLVKQSDVPDPWLSYADGRNFDCLFMKPHRSVFDRLRDHPAEGSPLNSSILDRIAQDALAIVVARVIDLSIVEDKLLPSCGFSRISRVLLAHSPLNADVTDSQVIIIGERGSSDIARVAGFQWLPENIPIDLGSIVNQLAPDAKHKLQLFASENIDGCDSIIGEANWSRTDA